MMAPSENLANHPTHVVRDLLLHTVDWIKSSNRITIEICRCHKSFVFANSQTKICVESCIVHFPTTLPCSTVVDVLETSDVPILFSLPQMRNLVMTARLDPQGDKITCRALGMYSSPVEFSTMGHVVLDLTSLSYQPRTKSSDRIGNPN